MTDNKTTETVRVTSDGRGHGRVTVNDQDISRGVRGVTVRITAGSIPQVELTLSTFDVRGDVEGDVVIPDGTREALLALGWKAPDGAA